MPSLWGRESHNGSRAEQVGCTEREGDLPLVQEGVGHQPVGRTTWRSTACCISGATAHSPYPAACSAATFLSAATTYSAAAAIQANASTCSAAAARSAAATCSTATTCSTAAARSTATTCSAATARSAAAYQTCCPCISATGSTAGISRPPALNIDRTGIRTEEGCQYHWA